MDHYLKFTKKSQADKAIHMLEGILKGMAFDGCINETECFELSHWLEDHKDFSHLYPLKEAYQLLTTALEDKVITSDEKEDLLWFCKKVTTSNTYYDLVTSDLQRLNGLLHGIISDQVIKDQEVKALQAWLLENSHLETTYPYDELTALVMDILKDGHISHKEKIHLERYILEFVDTSQLTTYSQEDIAALKAQTTLSGVCALDPKLDFKDKIFCFTGKSSRCSREDLETLVTTLGGQLRSCISKQTHYLIVGSQGNPCWSYACYGRKIEKAMHMRKQGSRLLIVHENDFWDTMDDL